MAVASLVAKVEAQVATFQKQFAEASRTAQKFEKDFANSASSVTAQQKRISDAFSTFGGDRVTREATAVAKAVEQIGGAARLTASEQARVNAIMAEAITKYAALGQQAPKSLLDLEAATRKVAAATVEVPKQLTLADKAAGLLSGTFAKFTAAGLVTTAITGITTAVAEFVSRGSQLRSVETSFDRLASSAKQSSADMLGSLRAGTRGMVQDIDLMLSANKALLLGLPVTAQSMGELSTAATSLGRAMGLDATQSLDDLITALGRSSPLILDNLGLSVKLSEANEKYAAKLGITADSLTEAERKTAFYQAAMEAARQKTAELGEQTKTLGEIAQTVFVSSGNVITRFASNVNVGLGSALGSLKNFALFSSEMIQFGTAVAIANAALREQIAAAGASAKATVDNTIAARNFVKELQRTTDLTPHLTAEGKKQYDAALKLGVATEELTKRFGLSELQQKLLAQSTKDLEETQRKGAAAAKKHTQELKEQAKAFRDLIAPTVTITKGMGDLKQSLGGAVNPDVLSGWSRLEEEMARVSDRIREMASHPLTSLPGVAVQLPKVTLPQTFWQTVFNPAQIGVAMGNAISSAIQGGGNVFASAAGALGQGLTTKLSNYLTTSKDKGGFGLSGLMGGMVSAVLPGVGALLGPLVGKITEKLKDAFGGPSKSELAGRDVVSSFEQTLANSLTAAQKLSTGNVSWKNTTIAVGNAYLAAGRTAAQAEAAVSKLWASSKGGADRARLAVLEIQAVMDGVNSKTGALAPTFANAAAAAEALGLDINKIGDGINSLRVADMAKDMVANWNILVEAGGDVSEMAEGSAKKFQILVDESLKWGHALPDSLRPILQKMTDMGLLTDAAGNKLGDLNDIHWDKPLGDSIDGLKDSMRELAQVIRDEVGGALRGLPDINGIRARGDVSLDVPGLASGGIVRKPTLALVGEAGPEAVVPLSGGGAVPAQPVIHNHNYFDGREMAEALVPHIPHVVRRRV